ncbi:MurR/RpiR family transcriptional regulator [Brevibacterium samyangense]|uniref:MurR/RpiR family transcriptional regulator n=1 Tax=Brevibacterium samyangense TaxID=366888 RepID=A0ABN2TLP6_9MICO
MTSPDLAVAEPGGVLDRIRSVLPSLIPSERRVATEVVENPDEVLLMSAASIAARTETSAATVSRACQNLGFQGYQHLRLLLAQDVGRTQRKQKVRPEGTRGMVTAQFEEAARSLSEALGTLDFEAFDRAVDLIDGANRLLLVGNGGSGPLAQMLAVRFLAAERGCEAPADSVVQLLSATGLQPGDVCLVISESGSNSVTLEAAKAARASGASVIGVTAYARTRLTDLSDVALVAGASYNDWAEQRVGGNIVQILLLGALHSAVVERRNPEAHVSERVVGTLSSLVEEPLPEEP